MNDVHGVPVRRLSRDEAFTAALERMPPAAVIALDDMLDGKPLHPDLFRACEPHFRELLAVLRG